MEPHFEPAQPPGPAKKPWYKRWWAIALAVLFGIGLIGSILDPDAGDGTDAATPDASASPTTEEPAAAETTTEATPEPEPAYDGEAFVNEALEHWLAAWGVSSFDEIEPSVDPVLGPTYGAYVDLVHSDEPGVLNITLAIPPDVEVDTDRLNTWAAGQVNLIGYTFDGVAVMRVFDADGSQLAASDAPERSETDAGLTVGFAQVACERAGETEFPWGFDPHWWVGVLNEEILADRVIYKVEVTVTNAYNAETRLVMECEVGGTESSPTLEHFLVY